MTALEEIKKALEGVSSAFNRVLAEAPAESDHYSIGFDCQSKSIRINLQDMRTIAELLSTIESLQLDGASLSTAEPLGQDENPMRFFAENVDKWGALEWFNRMVAALQESDKAVGEYWLLKQAGEDTTFAEIGMEFSKNIITSSAYRLARDFKDQVRTALASTGGEHNAE